MDLDRLVGARADADLGESRGVHADPVGWQNARFASIVEANIEPHDRIARIDSLQVTTFANTGRLTLVATVAEVFVAGQPGSALRRQRSASRPARKLARPTIGADERAAARAHRGDRIQADVTGGSRLDLIQGRPAAADTHDRHDPPQRLGHLQRLLGRVESDDGNLVFGQLERNRLLGCFEVDHLGDQPAVVHNVPELFIAEYDTNRILGRVDLPWPMQVPDHLDDGKELNPGTFGDVAQSQAIADPAPQADRGGPAAVADGGGAGFRCKDLNRKPRGPLETNNLNIGVERGGPSGPCPSGVMSGPTAEIPGRTSGAGMTIGTPGVTPGGSWAGVPTAGPSAAGAGGGVPDAWARARVGFDPAARQSPKRHAAMAVTLDSTT